jgi:type 1 glutamine amidotransferase
MRQLVRIALAALALPPLAGCNEWRALFPAHVYESEPPELPADLRAPALLVFTKTNGFRHREAIPAGLALLERIASRRGWSLYATENGATFEPERLARFAATVWLQTSGDTLAEGQKAALRAWLEAGGGFVGIHGAGGDFHYEWDWYADELVGARFVGHPMGPQLQDATVHTEVRDHPATRHLPERWVHREEWYSFERSPRAAGATVLASVDERSYSPRLRILFYDRDLSMGEDHPVIWNRCVGRGRALYSALGHEASAVDSPEVAGVIEGAIAWAARVEGAGCD